MGILSLAKDEDVTFQFSLCILFLCFSQIPEITLIINPFFISFLISLKIPQKKEFYPKFNPLFYFPVVTHNFNRYFLSHMLTLTRQLTKLTKTLLPHRNPTLLTQRLHHFFACTFDPTQKRSSPSPKWQIPSQKEPLPSSPKNKVNGFS